MHFNAAMLRIARQLRGLSQSELSERAELTQGALSKIENGLLEATETVADKLAAALDFPASFFFETDRAFGLPISVHAAYRKKASVGARALATLESQLNLRLIHLRRLVQSVDIEAELHFPEMDIDDFGGDPERIAELLRRSWLIPSGPLPNLLDYVERAGCVVFPAELPDLPVDGVTLAVPGLPRCIVLNTACPGDRQRFTLAHELGHLIMHRVPSPTMEDEANQFASALLMPANDIRPYFGANLSIKRLAELKPIWRVSMQAILYRAKQIGAIDQHQSGYLWRQMSALHLRRREPPELDISPEKAAVLPEIFRFHAEDLGYGLDDFRRLLHTSEHDLHNLYPFLAPALKPTLRIVR